MIPDNKCPLKFWVKMKITSIGEYFYPSTPKSKFLSPEGNVHQELSSLVGYGSKVEGEENGCYVPEVPIHHLEGGHLLLD